MRIKSYDRFLTERSVQDELNRVVLAYTEGFNVHEYIANPKYTPLKYFRGFTKGEKSQIFDMPILNYGNYHTQRLVKNGNPANHVYNSEEAKEQVASKSKWHTLHTDCPHIPKTVTDKNQLETLKFPIIAKPDNNFSGRGIMKFETLEETQKADLDKFDVFCEKVDIKEEHRVFMFRGEPLMWMTRIAADDSTKNMSKKADDKLHFNYCLMKDQLPSKKMLDVCNYFYEKHTDLDFYTVDFMVDVEDKPWVVEMSSEAGVPFGVMGHVYKKIYEDYYGKPLSAEANDVIDGYIEDDIETTLASDKQRFSIKTK